jgi:hypothetical protein
VATDELYRQRAKEAREKAEANNDEDIRRIWRGDREGIRVAGRPAGTRSGVARGACETEAIGGCLVAKIAA